MNTNGVFLIGKCDFFKDYIKKEFKKAAEFNIDLSNVKYKNILDSGNYQELITKIFNDFNNLFKKQNDDVFKIVSIEINGFMVINELSLELAKNLNLPFLGFYQDEKEAILHKISSLKCNIDELNLGFYIQDKYYPNTDYDTNCNILEKLKTFKSTILTPIRFENHLLNLANEFKNRVILPESQDERVLKACEILQDTEVVKITLVGDKNHILAKNPKLNLDKIKIVKPEDFKDIKELTDTLFQLRKSKGLTIQEAQKLCLDPIYFSTMMVYCGYADAMVCGAITTTAKTIRPALQIIKTQDNVSSVSGAFIMCLDKQILFFADCAVNPNPSPEILAQTAIVTAKNALNFNIKPKIAFLSYSSGNSGSGESVELIKKATALAKQMANDEFEIDGPLQFDAAIDKDVALLKMPNSNVAGNANIFIFPDLNSGNIAYKAIQRTSNALAIGPILQGLKKPVNDLSRGCLVKDIVNTILISAIQAGNKE